MEGEKEGVREILNPPYLNVRLRCTGSVIPVEETECVARFGERFIADDVHRDFHSVVGIRNPRLFNCPAIRFEAINYGFAPDGQRSKSL